MAQQSNTNTRTYIPIIIPVILFAGIGFGNSYSAASKFHTKSYSIGMGIGTAILTAGIFYAGLRYLTSSVQVQESEAKVKAIV